jgi:hypothetical protein
MNVRCNWLYLNCCTPVMSSGKGNGMALPELPVVAQGDGSRGERWFLKAGGSPEDYFSMMETVHRDGRRDEGGMGGPALYPGQLLNVYTGRADRGPLRVIVRTDQRVRRLRFQSERGEHCEMLVSAYDPAVGVNLFAILLPWTTGVTSMQGLDDNGQILTD